MKNRPHSTRSSFKKSSGVATSVKSLFMSGIGLIGIGSLLLLTFFVSTNSLQQSQENRSDASITKSGLQISQTGGATPGTPPDNTVVNYLLTLINTDTAEKKLEEVSLQFDVITDITNEIEITPGSPDYINYTIETEKVDHGFKVLATATPKTAAGIVVSKNTNGIAFIKIKFTSKKAGPYSFSYDREKSKAIVFGSNPKEDILQHVQLVSATVGTAEQPDRDDFILIEDNLKSYFKFYETTGSRNEVAGDNLVKDRTYTVRHVARVQNVNEEDLDKDPVIVNQLKINDSESVTRTFRRSDLTRQSAPIELVFETTFKAKEENEFQTTIDSTQTFLELNENNNTTTTTFSSDFDVKSCNERCQSNADCKNNYACHDTGDGKRCRRADNLSSSSCSRKAERNRTCNQDCSNDGQCINGLTCSSGKCRNSYDVNSTSCAAPSSQIQQDIKDSCGKACSDNRGCANNMRCFNGSCRLATNPSSTSCTAATEPTITKGYTRPTPPPTIAPIATSSGTVTVTPVPTSAPSPTPVATPMPTPEPTPEVKPNETVLDTFFSRITNIMSGTEGGSIFTTALLPLAIIGAGVLLLIVAIIVVLKPSKKEVITSTITTTPVSSTPIKPELHAQPNPEPPPIPGHGVIMPQKSGGYRSNVPSSNSGATPIPRPTIIETPPAPTQSSTIPNAAPTAPASTIEVPPTTQPTPIATPQDANKPSQSMIQRLREKGVNIPENNT